MTTGSPPAVTASTRVAGVIGSPVRHSLSPVIHNAAFRAHGDPWVYVAFEVAPHEATLAVNAMRVLGLAGLSVTMPHKELVVSELDRVDERAKAIGAVNTIVREGDGTLSGHNTDGVGCVDALRRAGVLDADRAAASGVHVAVVGAGATARAVIAALVDVGVRVGVVNRSIERAEAAVALGNGLRAGSTFRLEPGDVADADVLINATPLGMNGVAAQQSPVPLEMVSSRHTVLDAVYHPLVTPLLARAQAVGATVVDGLDMLCAQAARQQHLWLGRSVDVAIMRDAALGEIQTRQQ